MHIEVRDLVLLDMLPEGELLDQVATRLGVSRSAVSHHLSSLERRLRLPLWQRGGQPGATREAMQLAEPARAALRAFAAAEEEVSRLVAG